MDTHQNHVHLKKKKTVIYIQGGYSEVTGRTQSCRLNLLRKWKSSRSDKRCCSCVEEGRLQQVERLADHTHTRKETYVQHLDKRQHRNATNSSLCLYSLRIASSYVPDILLFSCACGRWKHFYLRLETVQKIPGIRGEGGGGTMEDYFSWFCLSPANLDSAFAVTRQWVSKLLRVTFHTLAFPPPGFHSFFANCIPCAPR